MIRPLSFTSVDSPLDFALDFPLDFRLDGEAGNPFAEFLENCGGLVTTDTRAISSKNEGRPILQGQAMTFNGTDQHAESTIAPTASGSLEYYFKAGDLAGGQVITGSFNSSTSSRCNLGLTANNLSGAIGSIGSGTIISATTLQVGQWYHAKITWDGSIVKLFLDGIEEYSGAQVGSAENSYDLGIGALNNTGTTTSHFSGSIADVRINGDEQIWPLYNDGLSAIGGDNLTLVNAPAIVADDDAPDTANARGFTDDGGTIVLARLDTPAVDVLGSPTQWAGSAYPAAPIKRNSNARAFNGVDQYAEWDTGNADGDGFGAVTISAWVYSDASALGSYRAIWSKGFTAYNISTDNSHELEVNANVGTGYTLPTNEWVLVAVDYNANGEGVELRINGVTKWNGNAAAGDTKGLNGFGLAARLFSSTTRLNFHPCSIANVQITGDTNASYPLAEETGSIAYDTSGNGKHGTYINAPANVLQDVVHSNFENGFSLSGGAYIPAVNATTDAIGNPLTNPPVLTGHNGAETELDFYNIAEGGTQTTPSIKASGTSLTDYSFGDTLTNPLFKREVSAVKEDKITLFSDTLTGGCLTKAGQFFTI